MITPVNKDHALLREVGEFGGAHPAQIGGALHVVEVAHICEGRRKWEACIKRRLGRWQNGRQRLRTDGQR